MTFVFQFPPFFLARNVKFRVQNVCGPECLQGDVAIYYNIKHLQVRNDGKLLLVRHIKNHHNHNKPWTATKMMVLIRSTMLFRSSWILLSWLLINSVREVTSFSTTRTTRTSTPLVQVSKIETFDDFNALFKLADARYDEWIGPTGGTSRDSFRMATLEMYQEERPESTVMLAFLKGITVGAAELSPIEVQGCVVNDEHSATSCLYITDVVTDSRFRRKGIGRALIDALEEEAINCNADYLLLHVMPDNQSALDFYDRLKFKPPSEDLEQILNAPKLAENAGAEGQVLLTKNVSSK